MCVSLQAAEGKVYIRHGSSLLLAGDPVSARSGYDAATTRAGTPIRRTPSAMKGGPPSCS